VATSFTLKDMEKLATNYRQRRQNITNYEVKGTLKMISGISWVVVTKKEFHYVHNIIINVITA
jgi:hypothetical protein